MMLQTGIQRTVVSPLLEQYYTTVPIIFCVGTLMCNHCILFAAWLTDYNIRHNFSSPLRIDELMLDEGRIYSNVLSTIQSINDALEDVFDKYTIAEWIEQNIYPTARKMEELQKAVLNLKSMRTWPRRPLRPLNDLLRMGVTVLGNSTKD